MGDDNGRAGVKDITRFMFGVGVIDLTFIFLTFAIAQAGFVLNFTITPYHMALAIALTVSFAIVFSWYYNGKKRSTLLLFAVTCLILFSVLLVSSWALADHFYDVSYDGQWYHQGAIHLLMNGFNPIYQQAPDDYPGALFIDHYPGAFEISSAVIGSFTGHIEDGKLLNIFLMLTTFLIVFPVIESAFPKVGRGYAMVIAALAALNPICICQSLSYYVDGASASLLAMLVFLLIMAYKKMDRLLLLAITMVIVLVINVKFFNLAYAGVIVLGFIAICRFERKSTRLHYLLVLSLFIGLLFGVHPYVTNILGHGTPFYPVSGISPGLIAGDMPPNLAGKNSLEQLAISLFSESDFRKSDALLKVPFSVSSKEIESFYTTDSRAGGFGPWFSGIILLAALIAVFLLFTKKAEGEATDDLVLLVCLLLFLTVVINPASWWARYVSQLWLIPLLLLPAALQRLTGKARYICFALILAMALNVGMVAYSYYSYQTDITHKINQQIDVIRSLTQNRPAQLYCGLFIAVQDRYREQGINFVLTDIPPDRQWSTLAEVEASYGQVTFY